MRLMNENKTHQMRQQVDAVYRCESRRVFATLIRLLGDFDLAEEATHEAFAVAMEQWLQAGIPANLRAWLVSVGRFRAIDAIRRRTRFDASLAELAQRLDTSDTAVEADEEVEDGSPTLDLHLLPSRPATGGSDCVDLTGSLRPDDGGNCQCLFAGCPDVSTADRPRQSENSRRPDSIPSPVDD